MCLNSYCLCCACLCQEIGCLYYWRRSTQWLCVLTEWLFVLQGAGPGEHGALKVVFSSVLRSNNPHSGCVYPQSGCLCCRGRTLVNMGLWKLFYKVIWGEFIHKVVVCAHRVIVCLVIVCVYNLYLFILYFILPLKNAFTKPSMLGEIKTELYRCTRVYLIYLICIYSDFFYP